jgi:hypothetical protein
MTVRVVLDELIEAFADASPALSYFVDRETGEVILVSDTLGFIEAGLQRAEMSEAPGRYLPVPVSGLDEFVEDLEAFIDELDDKSAQEALEGTLDAPDPRKALDAYLAKHDSLTSLWTEHRNARFRTRAVTWLKESGFSSA